ncbi:MAG: hypothetical protein Q7T44_01005 [Parvibaculum sp.]|nr:hypothetical protein [Parvibaculum sp.]
MRSIVKAIVITLSLSGAAVLATSAADAGNRNGAAISLNFGNVAFAYSDGYWDNNRRWHRWSNANEQRRYQKQYHKRYNNHRHDRDDDRGWRRR